MILHAPQFIVLILLFWGTGYSLANHGKPKTGKHSFGGALFADALLIGLLYWGGFFGQN